TGGEVRREAGIDRLEPHVAERAVVEARELAAVTGRHEASIPVRDLERRSPGAVEQILNSRGPETAADALVGVVVAGGARCAAPVAVLIHEVFLQEHHAT